MNTELETLNRISILDHYINWKAEIIHPWIGKNVLEVGSGIGIYSWIFLNCEHLIVSDIQAQYLSVLRRKYGEIPNVSVEYYNITHPYHNFPNSFEIDTIVVLDVLEHIRDDSRALTNMAFILPKGGRIILLIPANSFLFGSLDINLGHYRRYTMKDIQKKLEATGYEIEKIIYFNLFGVFGWFFCSRILHSKIVPVSHLKIFNWLTPLFIKIEQLIKIPFGLSMIIIGKKV